MHIIAIYAIDRRSDKNSRYNTISYLVTAIRGSIYNNTNRTAEEESSTNQFVLSAKIEPQILSGNWTFRVDQGITKDFKAKFISMVHINGTEPHVYELHLLIQ
jgi:hypothetical protein